MLHNLARAETKVCTSRQHVVLRDLSEASLVTRLAGIDAQGLEIRPPVQINRFGLNHLERKNYDYILNNEFRYNVCTACARAHCAVAKTNQKEQ